MVMFLSISFLNRIVWTPEIAFTTVDFPCATCPIVPIFIVACLISNQIQNLKVNTVDSVDEVMGWFTWILLLVKWESMSMDRPPLFRYEFRPTLFRRVLLRVRQCRFLVTSFVLFL